MRGMRWGLLWLLLLPWSAQATLKLVVLDVGEGQAVLLQQGEEGFLIDTGHAGVARHILARMQALGVKQLHAIALSHFQADRASGYFRLREAFPDAPVIENGQPLPDNTSPDTLRWVMQAVRSDPARRVMQAGESLQWGEATLRVLWPREFTGSNINLHSMVWLLEVGETRALLMGDVPSEVELALLKAGQVPDHLDVLVAGHHAASDTGNTEFLAHAAPHISVISVNANNVRGYPNSETLRRLSYVSGEVLRTDKDGEVCLELSALRDELRHCP